ncbi:hypothetical protein SCD92_12860 [Gilvimarinus sp. SDUM040013]|uniref:Protein-tyrosine-phosphatase n=1 Tax=Gilvimarinus gilvus TaxID=3058038 RepID=A0ABU4RZD6_9GAMM|nr:hypothetical protein [Gilvimarinus sp. SDUM040013]
MHVGREDIEWADFIFVMEKSHKKKLAHKFGSAIKARSVVSLDIPDNYEYMDSELIAILKRKVARYFA